MEMMGKIKGLLADESTLKRLISEGDYPAAIQKCLECQSTLGTLIQFKSLQVFIICFIKYCFSLPLVALIKYINLYFTGIRGNIWRTL